MAEHPLHPEPLFGQGFRVLPEGVLAQRHSNVFRWGAVDAVSRRDDVELVDERPSAAGPAHAYQGLPRKPSEARFRAADHATARDGGNAASGAKTKWV